MPVAVAVTEPLLSLPEFAVTVIDLVTVPPVPIVIHVSDEPLSQLHVKSEFERDDVEVESKVLVPLCVADAVIFCDVIGVYMFSEDKELAKVSIAYSVRSIKTGAFSNCIDLTTVTFHANYIQDVHFNLPNGKYENGNTPADGTVDGSTDPLPGSEDYITYLVRRAQSRAVTLQNGIDGIEGTADDYYSFDGYYKLIGLDKDA